MMRCEWTSRRFPQQCVLPSPQTPTTLLSTAHSGSARPTPADEANGPVGIAWRAWELWSRGRANTFECRRGICSRSDAKLRMFTGHTRTRVAGVGRAPHAPSVGCRVHTTRGRVTQPPERFPAPRMGAFASQSARATRNELKVLQDIAFRRALRKQDRRLDRDAEALRKERRATGGKTTDGGDGERDNARRTTSNETTDEGRSHISSMPKREPSEKRRTKRLGARRRRARRGWSARDGTRVRVHDASWNGIREGNNGGVTRKGDSNAPPNPNPNPNPNGSGSAREIPSGIACSKPSLRFETLLKQCAGDDERAVRRQCERECRRRETSSKQTRKATETDNGTRFG